jgi:hypothetical protein
MKACSRFSKISSHAPAHDYEDDPNEGDNCDEEDEEDELSDVGTSWIECWVDQPTGE